MPDRETANIHLGMAAKDLAALTKMAGDTGFAEEVFGLHAQQAVEKALKAWLCLTEAPRVPRIHDLEELAALLAEQNEQVPEELQSLLDLTDFAVQFRYEPYPSFGEPLNREAIASNAGRLIEHVREKLEQA